ncbi:contact-dependent growth inhibition system immunity protein [Dechloromonas denitrificans]|uniref:contact-dependent growth inhibition system immunity protein n=1 Tax=Dechloromonas denitrificans TaxID=281362 RepID=UPI001CF88BA4|nr:contact-dependent growth inhibition system immunity protein [Dechloromonas denitrificans]UCV04242.1 hypothetical protein KI611_02940 [Dechloromonas denitrificans]
MTSQKLNALEQLLGSYFHQDWAEEFDSDKSAIQAIIESEPKEQLLAGAHEIDELLGSSLTSDELGEVLINKLGCYFDPATLGLTCEQWLKKVRQEFQHQH